jgi:hypothetical protein
VTRARSRSRVHLLLFVAAAAISAFTIRRGIDPFDEGLTLQAARRVAEGHVPYSDFQWAYGPAHPYLLAAAFKVFGTSLMWWRIVRVVVDAAVALVVFELVRREAPMPVALVSWLTAAAAIAQPTGANPFAPALLFALLAVLVASGPPDRRRWIAAGALCALAAAWRLDFGAYALLGALATATLAATGVDARRLAVNAGAHVAGAFAALTALVYLPFVIADGPADAWRDLVGRSLSQGRYWRLPFPVDYDGRLRPWGPGSFAHDAKDVLDFYVPLILLAGLALVALVLVVRRTRPRPAVGGLAVLSLVFVAYLLSRTDEFHSQPLIVTLAALLPILAMQVPRGFAVAMAVVAALLLAYGAANRLSALFKPPAMSPIHLDVADGVEAPPSEARSIEQMVAAVRRRVPAGQPIYAVTRRSDLVRINDPLIYVLTERDNPTRQDFALQTGAPAQREIVPALERARPKVIVRWTSPESVKREPNARGRPTGIQILDRWLAAHYRLAERHGYYDVLVPSGG